MVSSESWVDCDCLRTLICPHLSPLNYLMRQKNHNPNALCLALTLLLGVMASTAVVAQTPAQEVRVQLRNGDRITGRLLAQETNHIVIATSWSESLSLPISSITGFETITGELLFTAPTVKPASNPAVVSAPKQIGRAHV